MSRRRPVPLPARAIDETGRRYGRLVVREYVGVDLRDCALWRVVCDCGRERIVRGGKLRAGRVVSCGCERADPAVRRAAREKVPARRRREIARMGQRACAEARARKGRRQTRRAPVARSPRR